MGKGASFSSRLTIALSAVLALGLSACATARATEIGALDQLIDIGRGQASYFGNEMAGNRTASGEKCDPDKFTAAHRTVPLGSRLRVTDMVTGRSVVVRVNDRGPFSRGRVIDLSRAAAKEIGLFARGHGEVQLSLVQPGERGQEELD